MGITQGQILKEGSKITSFIAVFMASFPMAITLSMENDRALFGIIGEFSDEECLMRWNESDACQSLCISVDVDQPHGCVVGKLIFFFFCLFLIFIKTRQMCFDNTLLVLSYAVCRKIMNANFTSVRVKRLHGNAQKQQTALLTLLPDLCFTVEHQKSVQR